MLSMQRTSIPDEPAPSSGRRGSAAPFSHQDLTLSLPAHSQSISPRHFGSTSSSSDSRRNSNRQSRRFLRMLSSFATGFTRSRGTSLSADHENHPQCKPRLPIELYRPILQSLSHTYGQSSLLPLLTVNKSMAYEVLQILYHTIQLSPSSRRPIFSSSTAQMVRSVSIRLGIRHRTGDHTQWCMDLLPDLYRLQSLDIRGRGWDVSVFDSCLPRIWDGYVGMTGITSFTYDGAIDLPVIRFLAAQKDLTELEIVSGMSVPFSSSDVLEIVSVPYQKLKKVTIPHAYAKAIIRLAPHLKHLSLTFDLAAGVQDVAETLSLLPSNLHSLVLNTSRRDFLPAHAFLPRGLKALSTVLVLGENERLIGYLARCPGLETVVLNVYQAITPQFINPFAPPLTPSTPSTFASTASSYSFGTPITPTTPSLQAFDSTSAEIFVSNLKIACPSIKDVQVDDQVYNRRGSAWREGEDGTMGWRSSWDIGCGREGAGARMWRSSL